MQYLKQSTAVTVKIGPFLDDSDGKTAETGLTIAQADVRLSKNGGDIAQKTEATSCTHAELGIYGCPLDATDTGTLGRLQLWVHESGALPVWHEYMVLPANVYDSMFSTDKLEVDLLQIGGVAQSATDLKDFADAGYDPSTHKVEACKANDDMVGTDNAALASVCTEARLAHLNADISSRSSHAAADIWAVGTRALTDKAGFGLSTAAIQAIWDALTANLTTAASIGKLLVDNINAAISSRSSHAAADVWAVGTRALTDKAGFTISGTKQTLDALNDIAAADVNAEVDTALSDIELDHLIKNAAADFTNMNYQSYLGRVMHKDLNKTHDQAADSIEAIRDRGDSAWVTGGGGAINDILNIEPLIPISIDLANTATVRIGLGLTNMVDDLPTTAEITPGTITIERKAYGATSWTAVVTDAACSEVAGLIYYDEVFDTATGYAAGDTIRFTFKSQKITVEANDFEITGSDGWTFQTVIREQMRGTDSAALASVCTEARLAHLNADISSRSSHAAADIWSVGTRALTDKAGFGLADDAITATKIATDAIDADALKADAVTKICEGAAISSGIAQAGSTYNNIILAAGESAVNDYYNGCLVTIVGGAGMGQARLIADYIGSTKSAVVDNPWVTAPTDTSQYRIYPFSGILLADTGVVAAAGASTVTLATTAPAIADTYVGHTIFISGGIGLGQARLITAYTNTRIATVSPPWTTQPDTTSIYMVLPVGRSYVNEIASSAISAIWDKDISAYSGAGYAGTYLKTVYDDWLNAGRLDLILDAIAVDVAGLNGAAMRGTDSAALASVCTEARLAELDAANLPADIDAILADTGTDGVVVASGSKTGYALSAAGVDAILDDVVEGTTTFRQMLRIFMAALAGKSAGGGTVTLTFRDIADAKNRISATVDADGNRTAITVDGA